MNANKTIQPTPPVFGQIPALRRQFRQWLGLALLTAVFSMAGFTAHAGNILVNPGFEADGNHGSGTPIAAWNAAAGGPWYINTDMYAHSGANYYKVWGAFNGGTNFQAAYQDVNSLPNSTYQADGWMFSLGTDLMWSGDDLDYCWLEVSFRDAGGNILALYKSDNFSDTLGSIPYASDTWYDFPITNVCEVVPPYSVIGSTNLIVSPPGTATVRFQHTLFQAVYGGGSVYVDDVNLNQTAGPVPPQITQLYPGNLLNASNEISFHITSASSTAINPSGIHLTVNGTDVSSSPQFTVTGTTPDIKVLYTGLSSNVWAYTASITVTDVDNFTASASMTFDTIQPAFVWEAEDYDFTNGMFIDAPVLSSSLAPNSYAGTTGTPDVDFYKPGGRASGSPQDYRTTDITGIGPASESTRQKFLTAALIDPAIVDYSVGYIAIGDWMNYTHKYPAGTYNIYGRLAGGAGATVVAVTNVTQGTLVGNFEFNGSDWGAYKYVPLVDGDGNVVSYTFDGSQQTLSVSLISGGDNMNFFMLVPAAPALPQLSNVLPVSGSSFVADSTLSFTASSSAIINNDGIHLTLNGVDVSSHLTLSGSGLSQTVSYPSLASNTLYTAVISVTNSLGSGISRTITFDTMSTANFYVKAVDYDFNSGNYDTADNGLSPNWYLGENDSVLDVDYNHGTDGNFPYRVGMATEVTSDLPLPGYTTGSDYDVGYFDLGNWANYTRNYPPGNYFVYGRLAGGSGTATAYLDKVTSGAGTSTQATQRLGIWTAVPGGWQNWVWLPLRNTASGAPVTVTLGGVSTLRLTSGNNVNANYFMLVPAQPINLTAKVSTGSVQFTFPSNVGASYSIYYSTSLIGNNWTLLTTVAGDGTVKTVTDSAVSGGQRFYKVTSP